MDQLPSFDVLSQMTDQQLTNLFGVRDHFVYELDLATIAHGASGQGTFTIQADSSFLWQEGCFFASVAGAAQEDSTRILPLMSLTIQDTSSGRQLMSAAVPVTSLFGYGSLPFILPSPRFFRANTQVTVSVSNFDAAVDYDLKLSFIGTKFFKFAQTI